jgi:hypothetical protein
MNGVKSPVLLPMGGKSHPINRKLGLEKGFTPFGPVRFNSHPTLIA